MSRFDDLPLHDFPVRAIRRLQANPANLRAEQADSDAFREVFTAVLRRLEGLSEQDRMRWPGALWALLWFVLSWALRRRPGAEREELLEAARSSQMDVKHREEVAELTARVAETWKQELVARGRAEGEARGRTEGEISARQEDLRLLLEERFGPLPQGWAAQIARLEDPERLRNALRQAVHLNSLEALQF